MEECVLLVVMGTDKSIRHSISVALDGTLRSRMFEYSLWTGVSDLTSVVFLPANKAADIVLHLVSFQYLDRIGQLFFGVPPKQTSSYGGLLGKVYGHGSGY